MFRLVVIAVSLSLIKAEIKPQQATEVGGQTNVDLTNAEMANKMKTMANFAVKKLNEKSNDLYHHSHVRMLDARQQVVAGFKYTMTFYMGQTTCAKNQVTAEQAAQPGRCPVSNESNAKFNKCTVTVWDKSWDKDYPKLLSDTCNVVPRTEAMRS